MGRDLPDVGTVTYNDFTFPAPLSAKITATTVYDEADRNIKYVNYVLTIECIVLPDDEPQASAGAIIAENLDTIREQLLHAGKSLQFSSQGFGSFTINDAGGVVKDIKFGPKPRMLVWEPIGSNRAVRIVWTVETSIPECDEGVPRYANRLASFTYDARWSITENGLTRRSIMGTLEIPAQFNTAMTGITDTADAYRKEVGKIKLIKGFHRQQDYSLSRDKRTLDFVIVDTEIPSDNAFWPGTVKADIEHSIRSSLIGDGYKVWHNEISGSIEVVPGERKNVAYLAFLHVVKSRRDNAPLGGTVGRSVGQSSTGGKTSSTILDSLSITDEVYGRTLQFSVRYRLFTKPSTMTLASGIFDPIPGTTWTAWEGSMSDIVDVRGHRGLSHLASDDVIIGLCDVASPKSMNQPNPDHVYGSGDPVFDSDCPTPQNSWLKFHNDFEIIEDTYVITHRKMGSPSTATSKQGTTGPASTNPPLPFNSSSSASDYVYQHNGPNSYRLRMFGYAYRLGYPIGIPTLTSIGGKTPVLISNKPRFKTKVYTPKCTLYFASWVIEYQLDGAPTGPIANLYKNVDGDPEEYQ